MELLRGSDSRGIAVAVAAVVGAVGGDIFALRGLRELPDFGEADAALGGAWRMICRKSAAGRGRAGVVDGPINDLASAGVLANIFDAYLAAQVASNRMLDIAEDPVMAAALRAVISTFGTALTQHEALTNEHQASLRDAAQEIAGMGSGRVFFRSLLFDVPANGAGRNIDSHRTTNPNRSLGG